MEMSGNVCANGFNYRRKLHPLFSHFGSSFVIELLRAKLLYNVPNIAGSNMKLTYKL